MEGKFADLHVHTALSDGTDSVEEVVGTAKERGISCVALTDHDSLHEELGFRSKLIDGVEVINGAELNASVDGTDVEVLAYFIDTSDEDIQELVDKIRGFRRKRMEEMVEKVNSRIDRVVGMEEVRSQADTALARPHLAKALKEKGAVESVSEAFERFIGKEKPCYVSTKKLEAEKVIDAIHSNGGVASLAHPGRDLPEENHERIIEELVDAGLDALEVVYPYDIVSKANSVEPNLTASRAAELASKFNLAVTGGSDSHGKKSDKDLLGQVRLPYRFVRRLKKNRS